MERRKNDLETKMMGVLAGLRGETLTFCQLPLRMRFGVAWGKFVKENWNR